MKKILGIAMLAGGLSMAANTHAINITGGLDWNASGTYFTSVDAGGSATDQYGDGLLNQCADGSIIDNTLCSTAGGFESGPVTGFDYQDGSAHPGPGSIGRVSTVGGSLATDYGIVGGFFSGTPIEAFDFSIHDLPAIEWLIDINSGDLVGELTFTITSAAETDISDNQDGFWDLAGSGFFSFTCGAGAGATCEDEEVGGAWSISNSGNITLTAANTVPGPSVLALFGLGLAGLGFARRRFARQA